MAGDWLTVSLGDVLTLQRGFDLPTQDRKTGHIPIVSSSGISGSHSVAKVAAPGVVTGRYGTIGQVFYVAEDFWPLNTTLYVKDFKGNDARFVSYLLRTIDYEAHNDKSTVPGVNRNHLHTTLVRLPPLAEQRTIAGILGALDDKIELNRRMNETLEAMARAIFTSWFVDFDPVRAKMEGRQPFGMDTDTAALFPDSFVDSAIGPMPRGWTIGTVADLARYVNGKAYTKNATGIGRMVIRIAELNSGPGASTQYSDIDTPSENTAYPDDILFAWSGSLDVYRWHRDEAMYLIEKSGTTRRQAPPQSGPHPRVG